MIEAIEGFVNKMGWREHMLSLSPRERSEFLLFRLSLIDEEVKELREAVIAGDSEEVVDALQDIVVVAVGTSHILGIDNHKAAKEVSRANMSKDKGLKEGRDNPNECPDAIKPADWVTPDHSDNHGMLDDMFYGDETERKALKELIAAKTYFVPLPEPEEWME